MIDTFHRLQAALGDRYDVERELGSGGMATVYLARDLKHERQVAIKVLHPELAASLGSERFDREIRLAARLQHPHILGMFDSGAANGLLYYVMPFVQGESLRDRLEREGPLPIEDAVRIAMEVADALGHAHEKGIVHRDIKPENVLLANGHALVADFGIARAASESGQKLTQTGMALGTPTYMAPEQASGDQVGPAADLYSLGCMLYEMLAGEPPFTGKTTQAVIAKHVLEAVPSIRIVRDTVPEDVEDAIFAAMAKVPADRPHTAAEFAEMLGPPLGGTATRRAAIRATASRRTPSRQLPTFDAREAARAPWRRPRVLALALAVAAGAGLGVWQASHRGGGPALTGGPDPHRLAVLVFEDLSKDGQLGYLANGLTDALIGALTQVQGLSVVSRGGVDPYATRSVPVDSIARALGVGTIVRGSVEPDGDRIRVNLRLVDASGSDFQRASFEQPAANLLAIRDTVAEAAARLVRARLGEEIRLRAQRQSTSSGNAWAMLQRAELTRRQADTLAAQGDTLGAPRAFAAADSLAREVESLDPKWMAPVILRGTIAYRQSRLAASDPIAADRWIRAGLEQADRAVALEAANPDALELRGNLRYWRYLLDLEPDRTKARQLLAAARQDLETAVKVQPAQAGAWATLSHLYYQIPEKTGVDVNLAARRALEEDAFLINADVVLARLFFSSYDLGQFVDAAHWCEEGARRFPTNPRFVECQLWLLTTKAREPDVA
ncbi:MAG: protein kinase domain-containing protein, partial [Gemmatimonadota bacterium]